MISGINHITLAVSDLDRSIAFYRDLLGGRVTATWNNGAYLAIGDLWLCLSLETAVSQRGDDSHIAFSCRDEEFPELLEILNGKVSEWKENSSEGQSVYFLDPDGHKLEIHVGSMQSRLTHYLANRDKGVTVFNS